MIGSLGGLGEVSITGLNIVCLEIFGDVFCPRFCIPLLRFSGLILVVMVVSFK